MKTKKNAFLIAVIPFITTVFSVLYIVEACELQKNNINQKVLNFDNISIIDSLDIKKPLGFN